MTIASIKALEGTEEDGPSQGAEAGVAPTTDDSAPGAAAPLIHPAKLVDLLKDFPSAAQPKPVSFVRTRRSIDALWSFEELNLAEANTANGTPLQPPTKSDHEWAEVRRFCKA